MSDYCFKGIPEDIYKKIKELAVKDKRSIRAQMLYLIEFAIETKDKNEIEHEGSVGT